MLGTIGELLILIAFVASGLAGVAFFRAAQETDAPVDWTRLGRTAWTVGTGAIVATFAILVYLFATHQFQYAYVYQNSSLGLPAKYLISSAWAGQEGSFLLWIMFTGIVGLSLIKWAARSYEAPVMTVIAFCQVFLISMVVGLQLGPVAIGSSPFSTLIEQFPDAPVFQSNPNFVPADGTGLNDLLQNPWMVIHPPTLFVGFTLMIVPFAFAVTALWKKRYTAWVRPALPWTLLGVGVLGIGIAMGGYWAYVTLSFGGYWAWDPVENSSLVPWLVGVAGVHAMLIQKKSGLGHKTALFLSILAFMLVIYSTFLTRSGILGDISVHSFVDLGLNNQLLVWILAMGVVGFGLFALRYPDLPTPDREPHYLSREFMIFSGAVLLCAIAAVVILGTSAPIFGRIFRDNPASVPIEFYNKWTLPLSVGLVFLAGLGQLFWWNKMSVENVNRVLLKPMALSVAATLAVLIFTPFVEQTVNVEAMQQAAQPVAEAGIGSFWTMYGQGLLMLLLLFAGFFALFGNGMVLWRVGRGNLRMAGGALAHVGLALTILGIITSGGFSNPLTPQTIDRPNFVAQRGVPTTIEGYTVTYAGTEETERGRPRYIINVEDPKGRTFTAKPVVYKSNKDQWIQHPDVKMYAEKDIYVAVSPDVMFEEQGQVKNDEIALKKGEATLLGDDEYQLFFKDFDATPEAMLTDTTTVIPVGATLEVTHLATNETRTMTPRYILNRTSNQVRFEPATEEDWGLTLTFRRMNVDSGEVILGVDGVQVMPEDWVIVQAYEKPFINLLWVGIILLTGGFGLAFARRVRDVQISERRGTLS
ncbi:MAG: cytochrome C assembly protein [Bacteroidetes bacterium]|jgi:cytochrome c-type biogenesis protein CcmF|nr:cytochrome C assembly protein [Bacteroidota bacterium]